MIKISRLFPDGRRKALTLSYDDGITQDRRLLDIINEYKLKATFNLNSGLQGKQGSFKLGDLDITRLEKEEVISLYSGHEIAIHGLTHLSLTDVPKALIINEVLEDKKNHEGMLGHPVRGMAYAYGTYNEAIFDILDSLGVAYARTVNNHRSFTLPENWLEWNPTTHHNDPDLMGLAKKFIEGSSVDLQLFYLWGHSYEFDLDNNWEVIEEFSKYISNKKDVWYATNIQIKDYLEVLDRLQYTADLQFVHNPSAMTAWIEVNGRIKQIKPGETQRL